MLSSTWDWFLEITTNNLERYEINVKFFLLVEEKIPYVWTCGLKLFIYNLSYVILILVYEGFFEWFVFPEFIRLVLFFFCLFSVLATLFRDMHFYDIIHFDFSSNFKYAVDFFQRPATSLLAGGQELPHRWISFICFEVEQPLNQGVRNFLALLIKASSRGACGKKVTHNCYLTRILIEFASLAQ